MDKGPCREMESSFIELTKHTHTHTLNVHADPIHHCPNYRPSRLQSIVLTGPADAAGHSGSELFIVLAVPKNLSLRRKRTETSMWQKVICWKANNSRKLHSSREKIQITYRKSLSRFWVPNPEFWVFLGFNFFFESFGFVLSYLLFISDFLLL